jgi:hypothetical protein
VNVCADGFQDADCDVRFMRAHLQVALHLEAVGLPVTYLAAATSEDTSGMMLPAPARRSPRACPLELMSFGLRATMRPVAPAALRDVPLSPDGGVTSRSIAAGSPAGTSGRC